MVRRGARRPGDLRRQADRLQGRRPAARRLAAGPRAAPGRPPAGGRLRRRRGARCRRSSAASPAATSGRCARSPSRARARGRARTRRCAILAAFLDARPGDYAEPRAAAAGSDPASPAGSSTTRSRRRSPPPTPWSSRAPSPRPSAWSPPRRPRPGRCRSRPTTRAPPRSAASSPPSSARTCATWSRSSSTPDAVEAIAARLDALARARPGGARRDAAPRCAGPPSGCGAGTVSRGRARGVGRAARRAPATGRDRSGDACHERRDRRRAPSPRSIESRASDPRDLRAARRRDARAHGDLVGGPAPVRLVRRRRRPSSAGRSTRSST